MKQAAVRMVGCGPTSAMKPILILCMTTRPTEAARGQPGGSTSAGGDLQADAFGGYDGIYAGGNIIEVACWAHARRKFFDAKDTDGKRSAEMLAMVRELYAVEHQAKLRVATLLKEKPDATADDRHAIIRDLRQQFSVPILAKIKTWLEENQNLVLPRSPMAAAITYAKNQWAALNVYVTQGFLAIDNNAAERALKRVALGRKNWLFAGHDEAQPSPRPSSPP